MSLRVVMSLAVVFFIAVTGAMYKLMEYKAERREIARQLRYEACLTRTTPAVCELHLIEFPRPQSSDGGPGIMITPDGKVGVGVGF